MLVDCAIFIVQFTLHFPHFLLAPSDNDQVCECGAAGNTQLFDGDLLTGMRVNDLVSARETASSLAVLVAILDIAIIVIDYLTARQKVTSM